MLEKKRFLPIVESKSIPSTFKRLKVDAARDFPQNSGPFVRKNNGSREIYPEFPSNTKSVKVDATRNFPENCGPFVRQNNATTQIHPEFPSTKVDATRNFPENCSPRVLQKKNGSNTQCSVDAEVDVNVVDSAEPFSVVLSNNFEAKRDSLAAAGASPEDAADSSHFNISCQPLKMKEENLKYDESTRQVNQVLQKPSTKVDATRNFPENCGPRVLQKKNGSNTQCSVDAEVDMNVVDSAEPFSVVLPNNFEAKRDSLAAAGASPEDAADSSHLNISCQPLKMKEENLKYDESTQQVNQVLQKPSTKIDATRNFPENCGPQVLQKKNGSNTQCSVDAEVDMNVVDSAEPFSVVLPNNFEAKRDSLAAAGASPEDAADSSHFNISCQPLKMKEENLKYDESTQQVNQVLQKPSTKIDATRNFPENCGPRVLQKKNGSNTQCSVDAEVDMNMVDSAEPFSVLPNNFEAKRDSLTAAGASPEDVADSSHFNISYQPLKMKEENLMYDESTQQVNQVLQKPSTDAGNTCDWFIKGEPIQNGRVLPAIVSQENLIEGRNEPSKEASKGVHYKEVSEDESRSRIDDDEICILSWSEWKSLKSGLKTPSAGKKGGKGEIVPEPLHKCKGITEDESMIRKKQIDHGVFQEDLRNSAVMCGVSGHGLLTEHEHIQKVKEVREVLKLFDDVYTKLLLEDKAEKHEGLSKRRIHIEAAMALKNQNKWVNCEWTFGHVPGVEIGDQFRFRAELVTIGLHHQFFKGISYVNIDRKDVATSIVDSGRYENKDISSETFIYVGQGGNPKVSVNAIVEDQKLKGGNLALKNSMDLGCPVRVICGRQRVNGEKSDKTYIYYGLYTVTKCWEEKAPTGKYVYKFELKRNLGQPKLTREVMSRQAKLVKINHFRVNNATKSIMQSEFVVDYDVSLGKEKIPIPAVNSIDDERPPPFTYITNMQYPDWYYISRPQDCSCTSGCSDFEQCSCASRNGGEIPFNSRGSITRAKPLVYECGSSCKYPPSCKNRVSQHGPRYHLEVFKTESRGWGLRSRDYVPSGSFICEYVGELLDEKEAESRIDHDEYLFDVGNYDEEIPKRNVVHNNSIKVESNSLQRKDEDGFTIDAIRYGNVGRFINHSCSPNLYAQNVMYYHGDRRVPHIMFFASKSIAPLEEFTYHYNYHIDYVYDKNGSMKRKNCICGSRKCKGRMY